MPQVICDLGRFSRRAKLLWKTSENDINVEFTKNEKELEYIDDPFNPGRRESFENENESPADKNSVFHYTANSCTASIRKVMFYIICITSFIVLLIIANRINIQEAELHEQIKKEHDLSKKHNKEKIISKELPPPPKPDYNQCKLVKEIDRFDCFPDPNPNPQDCEARGCCWIPSKLKSNYLDEQPNVPFCFYPSNYNTYNYINVTATAFGLVAYLRRNFRTAYPNDIAIIKMIVKYETAGRLHVKMIDPINSRFETAYPEVPIVDKASLNLSYAFEIDEFKSGFKIIRQSNKATIFDSNNFLNLIYSNQFLQISTKLPSKFIYGLGEHRSNLLLSTQWSRFTLFNHDSIPTVNKNLYGSHPFYLSVENANTSHGVFLLNSNGMDVILQPTPAVTFRTIGGILDLYFFLGPTPADVIKQYTDLVGKPYMPPYWGLGFHLCRFGYKTLNETIKVMQRNIDAGIPLDTQWNDLDYMNNSNDFTYDSKNFEGLPEFVKKLHARGMHYIPLVDPGVSASEKPGTYPPYDVGIKMDIFVKNNTGQPFIGKVWNRATTVWPDFTHPNTVEYWTLMLKGMHKEFQFDGAWIDMNEPSNFLSGSFSGCPKSALESPPYVPAVDGGTLNYKTMCMSAKQYGGLHYNIHNLYGFTEAIVTNFAMAEIRGKRPMVISRSTFAGQGHFTGHWSGDVWSAWTDMKYTIPQLLSFSLFGIPLMGADICGFNGNTTEKLCNRWMQLGAFYPFSRNHNTDNGIDQDPVALGDLVVASSKKALRIRYTLLPYLYTLFHRAHVYGETVARPLFFEFSDPETYSIDTQFLWGAALMIVPVLEEDATSVTAYLPNGLWYDYYTKSQIKSVGTNFNLSAPLDTIPLLLRGGYILPIQGARSTTTEARKTNIELLVTLDANYYAKGELYWDDGDSLNSYEEKRYSSVAFEAKINVLTSYNTFVGSEKLPNLGSVTILGVEKPVKEVTVNGVTESFSFDVTDMFLTVTNLNVTFSSTVVVSWK